MSSPRQFVGKSRLLDFERFAYWNQSINERVLSNERDELDVAGKRNVAGRLIAETLGKTAE